MARDDSGAGSILLAFLLGAVSGAAVALLYAPASGRETRDYLGDRAREGRERATEAAEKGRQIINQGRDTITTAIDRGREAIPAGAEPGDGVSGSADVFLGIIAVSTLVMALVQVGAIVAAGMVARRIGRLADQVEHEMKPLFEHAHAISRDAARAAALAVAQVERADRLFADVARRVDETLNAVEHGVAAPAREGRAIVSAVRAAFQAIRDARAARARRARSEEEDALFI